MGLGGGGRDLGLESSVLDAEQQLHPELLSPIDKQ